MLMVNPPSWINRVAAVRLGPVTPRDVPGSEYGVPAAGGSGLRSVFVALAYLARGVIALRTLARGARSSKITVFPWRRMPSCCQLSGDRS